MTELNMTLETYYFDFFDDQSINTWGLHEEATELDDVLYEIELEARNRTQL